LPGQRIDQYGDVGGAVLPIGIERHDDVSPPRQARIRCRFEVRRPALISDLLT
jgi:hypothetical protein